MDETDQMTKGERDELGRLARRRAKLAKVDVDRVAAFRLAAVEQEFAAIYRSEDDAVWREANATAEEAVAEANARVAERCRELGIRPQFAPSISVYWNRRGEEASKDRVAELRRVAKTRLDADAKAAKVEIDRASLRVETELVAGGLRSVEARAFLEAMPTAEALLPPLTVAEIEKAYSADREDRASLSPYYADFLRRGEIA